MCLFAKEGVTLWRFLFELEVARLVEYQIPKLPRAMGARSGHLEV